MLSNFQSLEGYHGTDLSSLKSIQSEGFHPSIGDGEWLGDGVYFFTEGITGNPSFDAEKWAIAQSWDKVKKANKYLYFIVLYASMSVEDDLFLDLTTKDGMDIFNYIRDKYIDKIKAGGYKIADNQDFKDGHIINEARKNSILDIDVVKANFYIKFAPERKLNINFRIPNTTILAIFNTDCILKGSIKETKRGSVR
jgi:hypothetical protein